ncbi:beta-ketoacyl synthase N-terminal-like domain-containing protein, partial [Streptomyces sp. NPDC088184]|uniref:beta-ketoacyl synthase N-terminal-like domain-containing protein n=1 Tax=Streptomyces sp. NPDC088184 TaxID=3160991 RepID=UPI00342B4BD3
MTRVDRDVAVTGLGLVTPAGSDEHTFWEGLCAGVSMARGCEELTGLPVDFGCPVVGIDLDEAVGGRAVWRMARFVKMALVAARRAVADAGLSPERWDGDRVGVVLGVGVGGVSVLVDNVRRLDGGGPGAVSPLLVPGANFPPMKVISLSGARTIRGPRSRYLDGSRS